MIYTVTFNPSLDYIIRVENLRLGVINRTYYENILPGGKGINVSIVLKNMGHESCALGFMAGFTGREIAARLATYGVKLQAGDILIISGSVPNTLPGDMYERIMSRLEGKGIDIVVDAEKDLLVNVLKYHPFLIKPNNHELGDIYGVTLKTKDEVVPYAKKLQEEGARNVLISMAGEGAVFISEKGDVMKSEAPKGTVVNSVGAGDSMVAGFVTGMIESNDYMTAWVCAQDPQAHSLRTLRQDRK